MKRQTPLLLLTSLLVMMLVVMNDDGAAPVLYATTRRPPATTASAQSGQLKSVVTTPDVSVTFEIASEEEVALTSLLIYGRDQPEVRVENSASSSVELRRRDVATSAQAEEGAATQVVVLIGKSEITADAVELRSREVGKRVVEVSVPRGASVRVSVRSCNIILKDVSEARLQSVQGDLSLERVARLTEAVSVSGKIDVRDARGRMRLQTVSGDVSLLGARATQAIDSLRVASVSGDITLAHAAYGQIEIASVSGEIKFDGTLASNAQLSARTTSGGITLKLPANSSFLVTASVSLGGFTSDFPLTLTENSVRASSMRLTGTHGTRGATLDLASHSGSILIRRTE